jgi:hypothetical protein
MNERERELEALNAEDASWARLLSGASRLNATDENATDAVLSRLRLERNIPAAATDDWDRALSRVAELRDVDFAAVDPALRAVTAERHRVQHRRLVLSRVIAGFAAAAVIAGALVLRAPTAADPSEAYTAYQEANQGW